MYPKSAIMLALAGVPMVAAVLMFSGCDSGPPAGETDSSRNPRNELNQKSMDYMRQQYQSKTAKKK